jgi:hypothetical protein
MMARWRVDYLGKKASNLGTAMSDGPTRKIHSVY